MNADSGIALVINELLVAGAPAWIPVIPSPTSQTLSQGNGAKGEEGLSSDPVPIPPRWDGSHSVRDPCSRVQINVRSVTARPVGLVRIIGRAVELVMNEVQIVIRINAAQVVKILLPL